jgi:PAS domain S-box-containing protein
MLIISVTLIVEAIIIGALLLIIRGYRKRLKKKELYIEKMLDPLWVLDENNKTVEINPAFTNLFGYKIEEMKGKNVFEFVDEKNRKIVEKEFNEKRKRGVPSIYELYMK